MTSGFVYLAYCLARWPAYTSSGRTDERRIHRPNACGMQWAPPITFLDKSGLKDARCSLQSYSHCHTPPRC
jgi:hypothetical protein